MDKQDAREIAASEVVTGDDVMSAMEALTNVYTKAMKTAMRLADGGDFAGALKTIEECGIEY